MLASFPSFIADVLANVLRYRHEDAPVLVAQLVRDYPNITTPAIEEVVSLACDLAFNTITENTSSLNTITEANIPNISRLRRISPQLKPITLNTITLWQLWYSNTITRILCHISCFMHLRWYIIFR